MADNPAIYIVTGILLSLLLSGFVIGQGLQFLHSTKGHLERKYKYTVLVLLLLQSLHALMYCIDTVSKYAVHFGDLSKALIISDYIVTAITLNAAVDAIVQSFYAYRCFVIFERSWPVAVILGLAVCASVGSILQIAISQAIYGNYVSFIEALGWKVGLVFILPALCDLLITIFMLIGIRRSYDLGSSQGSKKVIKRLAILTIETNALTTLVQLVTLILYYTTQAKYSIFSGSLPQLYIFTFIVWLAARAGTRERLYNPSNGQVTGRIGRLSYIGSDPPMQKPLSVHIETSRAVQISSPMEEVTKRFTKTSQDDYDYV